MKSFVVPLNPGEAQGQQLLALQRAFAELCNALAPVVRDTRCWNRVALHHMMYKPLRNQFPAMGSQMVCNAIYSVCRASRLVYQGASSPFNAQRWGDKPLPLLHFADNCPVYFDRHTLSLKGGQLSMYTLDGRLRFELALAPEVEDLLLQAKLHEIVLAQRTGGGFELTFLLNESSTGVAGHDVKNAKPLHASLGPEITDWPEYLVLDNSHEQNH
jgi:hypothetical protein